MAGEHISLGALFVTVSTLPGMVTVARVLNVITGLAWVALGILEATGHVS